MPAILEVSQAVTSACRAKDPTTCKYHGSPVSAETLMREFTGQQKPTSPQTPTSARGLIGTALESNLRWDGAIPTWFMQQQTASRQHPTNPANPELLDIIDTPFGKVAVVWQPDSQEANDGGMLDNGMRTQICYYKDAETGDTLGYIKVTSRDQAAFTRTFGDDEFAPFRWRAEDDSRERHNYDFPGVFHFDENRKPKFRGPQPPPGETIQEQRRRIWFAAQRDRLIGKGVTKIDGEEIYTHQLDETSHHPSDAQVNRDLKTFTRAINKHLAAENTYYETPYVDFARVQDRMKGKGLGAALYVYTARRLAQDGKVLRGSSLQSDNAQAVWDKFRANLGEHVDTITLKLKREAVTAPILDFRE